MCWSSWDCLSKLGQITVSMSINGYTAKLMFGKILYEELFSSELLYPFQGILTNEMFLLSFSLIFVEISGFFCNYIAMLSEISKKKIF